VAAVAFVPVRGGSKSIPLKNIKLLAGKPLVWWSLVALQNSSQIEAIYVATDSAVIRATVLSFQFDKVRIYDRRHENAQDTSSTESVVIEFLETHPLSPDCLFVLCQATNPFVEPTDFDRAIKALERSTADSLLSVVVSKRFLWTREGTPLNYDFVRRPRRQDFEGCYLENGAFYVNRVENILKHRNRLSGKVLPFEMSDVSQFELDEPDDWTVCEELLRSRKTGPRHYEQAARSIRVFLTDVDGVLTDGGMYYSAEGEHLKKYQTQDAHGMRLLQQEGIKIGLVTSENSEINRRRADKMKLDIAIHGSTNKLANVTALCQDLGVTLAQVAYIGDDLNCHELLQAVGLRACPRNAVTKVKNVPGIIHLQRSGGEGAVREFADFILNMKALGQD